MPYWLKSNSALIIGDVRLKPKVNIWPNAVIRGDLNYIQIGEKTNVQDGCVIHVTEELPVVIGKNVTIGHNAVVHGCTVEDNVLIGMGAVVLDGSRIGQGSIIAAGSVVLENQNIPEYSLVAGVPGKIIKKLSPQQAVKLAEHAESYFELADKELEKVLIDSNLDN